MSRTSQFSLYCNVSVTCDVSPAAALLVVWSWEARYCVKAGFAVVDEVGDAVCGEVPVKSTVSPEPIEILLVISVVSAALVEADGVA